MKGSPTIGLSPPLSQGPNAKTDPIRRLWSRQGVVVQAVGVAAHALAAAVAAGAACAAASPAADLTRKGGLAAEGAAAAAAEAGSAATVAPPALAGACCAGRCTACQGLGADGAVRNAEAGGEAERRGTGAADVRCAAAETAQALAEATGIGQRCLGAGCSSPATAHALPRDAAPITADATTQTTSAPEARSAAPAAISTAPDGTTDATATAADITSKEPDARATPSDTTSTEHDTGFTDPDTSSTPSATTLTTPDTPSRTPDTTCKELGTTSTAAESTASGTAPLQGAPETATGDVQDKSSAQAEAEGLLAQCQPPVVSKRRAARRRLHELKGDHQPEQPCCNRDQEEGRDGRRRSLPEVRRKIFLHHRKFVESMEKICDTLCKVPKVSFLALTSSLRELEQAKATAPLKRRMGLKAVSAWLNEHIVQRKLTLAAIQVWITRGVAVGISVHLCAWRTWCACLNIHVRRPVGQANKVDTFGGGERCGLWWLIKR